ncbi:hypothetical protein PSACC_01876 [Paramicrosporidium saccamoebae]|uniref:Thymidylate kinase-like domain-containing protein n=1 Tax=Paramicrosporidium saccamoebae TaxID=1246581 RepID=A0A2H9TKP6_9FUNG|nr:hypothetical protein PSACC_01876 [Paramicrosporidium saccamoebae]
MRYPDRNSPHTGKLISEYLERKVEMPLTAASLLLVANLWEMRDAIEKELAAGTTILMDRYLWSHMAYSAARGMDQTVSAMIGKGLPLPDLTIFLDADPETVSQRGGYGLERFEKIDFQRQVSSVMCTLAQTWPECITRTMGNIETTENVESMKIAKIGKSVKVVKIDAHQDIETIAAEILGHLTI